MHEGPATQVRTFLRAKIIFNNRMSTIDCVIRKMSEEGALVELASAQTLPKHFDLEIPIKGKHHLCRLLSRDDEHASVVFERGEEGPSREALLAEVSRLRSVVNALTGRLHALGKAVDL